MPVRAASTGLSISPPVIEILLSPNKKVIHAFELTNQGESGDFVANLHLVSPTDSEGHVAVNPTPLCLAEAFCESGPTIPLVVSLANADRQLGKPFPLAAGEHTQLVLAIESASSDVTVDTYLALVIKAVPLQTSNIFPLSSSVPAISSLVLITLTPDGIFPIKLELTQFDPPIIHDSMTPLTISASVKNTAPVMLRPQGTLEILSPRGNHSQTIKLYPNLILGLSTRQLQALESPSTPALNQATNGTPPQAGALTYQPHWYQLGPYRLRLSLTTEGGSQITSVEKVVWLLPLRAILITILLAITITTLLLSARKSSNQREPEEKV